MPEHFFGRDEHFMRLALREAERAAEHDDVPIGAVLVREGEVFAAAGNERELRSDPTAHAETLVLRDAARKLGGWRLPDSVLYVTLEPCAMCAQAIAFARLERLTFGAYDPKGGGVEHGARIFEQATCHHRPEVVGGILERDCAALLQAFFRDRR